MSDVGYWDNGHMGNGSGTAMIFAMLGVWILIALAIAWFVRSTRTPTAPPTPSVGGGSKGAEQFPAERLARGEIDPEEYKDRLKALTL